jgi:hypothetical protein
LATEDDRREEALIKLTVLLVTGPSDNILLLLLAVTAFRRDWHMGISRVATVPELELIWPPWWMVLDQLGSGLRVGKDGNLVPAFGNKLKWPSRNKCMNNTQM